MRYLILLSLALLSACQTPPLTGSSGQSVPQNIDFQCKQQCGMYDSKVSIIGAAMCMNECVRAHGY